jgi:hypothetical protein
MIPRTYYDGNPEDWNYVDDFWNWLKDQPQDVWLLWARNANWDNADRIFERMVSSPICDGAVAAWIFWASDPAHYIRNPSRYPNSLLARIVGNAASGFYARSELFLDRLDTISAAIGLLKAFESSPETRPFAVPRALLGPFNGRRACAPTYDAETRRDLDNFFHVMDGHIDADEAAHEAARASDRTVMKRLKLPPFTAASAAVKDDAEAIKAIYGTADAYDKATGSGQVRTGPSDFYRDVRLLGLFAALAMGIAVIGRFLATGHWW